ncbi:MAG: TrmH family RNA methyltransferase [Oscillochloridaceae bacterium umkhey_bin13]
MITSPANPTMRQIRGLRQRKTREANGLCLLEGIRLVTEAIQAGAAIESLIVAPELLRSPFAQQLVAEQAANGTTILEVSPSVFASLSEKDGPQGLAAVVQQRWLALDAAALGPAPGWVALIEPADPGNLGTIIRTADGVGASGVIIVGNGADPYDPAALRAAMGATFALNLARATWDELVGWRTRHAAPLIGSSDRAATHFQQCVYPQPLILLMGSERQGLSAEQLAACDHVVGIPMRGRSDSLNLAVATGVLLYELLRG